MSLRALLAHMTSGPRAPIYGVRGLSVTRRTPDVWDIWSPGQCTCEPPAHSTLNLQAAERLIESLRPRGGPP